MPPVRYELYILLLDKRIDEWMDDTAFTPTGSLRTPNKEKGEMRKKSERQGMKIIVINN